VVLVSSGSEVHLCVEAAELLADPAQGESLKVRVVSLPSWDLFEEQEPDYRASVLPEDPPTLAVEAASPFGWDRYADDVLGIDRYGASAPGEVNMEKFGFTAANVASRARGLARSVQAQT